MPSEMRWVSWLILMIWTLTVWPTSELRDGWLTRARHVGDVQQAVDAAEIDERTVIGDVLDDAFTVCLRPGSDPSSERCSARVLPERRGGTPRCCRARLSIFRICERLRVFISGVDVAHRTDVHLRARQEGNGAAQIDGEAALDAAQDGAVDRLVGFERLLPDGPSFFAAGFVARQDGFAERVFDALEVDFDFVADLEFRRSGLWRRIPSAARGLRFSDRRR
jgi:hypothetical protein